MKARAVIAAAALLVASPSPAFAADQKISTSVGATIKHWADRVGANSASALSETKARLAAAIVAANGNCATAGNCGWIAALKGLGVEWPLQLGTGARFPYAGTEADCGLTSAELTQFGGCGGSFGGGGASGNWPADPIGQGVASPCDNFQWKLDADGNMVVPSLPLPGGLPLEAKPYNEAKLIAYNFDIESGGSTDDWWLASDMPSLAHWSAHRLSMSRGVNRRNWFGFYRLARSNANNWEWYGANIAHYQGTIHFGRQSIIMATRFGAKLYNVSAGGNPLPNNRPCPETQSGGTFDYYHRGHNDQVSYNNCTAYAKNYSLSPDGYAYNFETSIPMSEALAWPENSGVANVYTCFLNPAVIKKIAQKLIDKACAQPGAVTPCGTVEDGDVKTGGGNPQLGDLQEQPDVPTTPTTTPTDPDPPPTVDPPSPPGGSDECDFKDAPSGCTDPGTPDPTLDEPATDFFDPIKNWLPDLSVDLPVLGDESCPVWTIDMTAFAPDMLYLLDSHCTVAEQNRALISALMVALWTIGAAMIILRS